MAATATQVILDPPAAEFRLPATDGKTYALDDVAGEKGTVVVFICNHCPYVKAVIDRMVSDARVLMSEGVGFAAICSNDAASYPEDSFENMKRFAKAHDFPFPYLHDETQSVARAFGAVCTPDFFGYNADRKLKYRGRLDEGRTTPPRAGAPRELVEAMRAIATTGVAPADQKGVYWLLDQMEGRIKPSPVLNAPPAKESDPFCTSATLLPLRPCRRNTFQKGEFPLHSHPPRARRNAASNRAFSFSQCAISARDLSSRASIWAWMSAAFFSCFRRAASKAPFERQIPSSAIPTQPTFGMAALRAPEAAARETCRMRIA